MTLHSSNVLVEIDPDAKTAKVIIRCDQCGEIVLGPMSHAHLLTLSNVCRDTMRHLAGHEMAVTGQTVPVGRATSSQEAEQRFADFHAEARIKRGGSGLN